MNYFCILVHEMRKKINGCSTRCFQMTEKLLTEYSCIIIMKKKNSFVKRFNRFISPKILTEFILPLCFP